MSPEVALLQEVWGIVKPYVHAKEREEVAEEVISAFEEHVDLEDLEVYKNEFDSAMKVAISARLEEEEYDEDEDESQSSDW
jgi:hypothetical protein